MTSIFEFLNEPDYLFDSHAHISAEVFDNDRNKVVDDLVAQGIEEVWDMAIDPVSIKSSISVSEEFETVKSFIGIDPDVLIPGSKLFVGFDVDDEWFEKNRELITSLANTESNNIKGIGEIGIDCYWILNFPEDQQQISIDLQERLFRMQLEIASDLSLPVSVHSRNAEKKCLEIVSDYEVTGIFHSYTGDYETAKEINDIGWGLGVNGIVTFPNSNNLKDLYRKFIGKKKLSTPDQFYKKGIFFETDSPYLSPEGKRGKRNNPSNINDIFRYMCSLSE
jgi:TatD DNase family protein